VIAAAVLGIFWYQDRPVTGGTGQLIEAQPGDYKVKPDQPGGMQVAGEGDSVFTTSEGGTSNSSVDLAAVPETPIAPVAQATPKAQPAPTASPSSRVAADVPPPSAKNAAADAVRSAARPAAATAGGAIVQLGSFPSAASANSAWKQLSARFSYLGGLGQTVQQAEVNGRTVHRLRVNAGSAEQAKEICAKLKVAGEACFVVA
jgi:cell division septation protein DedD